MEPTSKSKALPTGIGKRTVTGITLVLVLIACISFGGNSYSALFFLITILSQWEFYTLIGNSSDEVAPQKFNGLILGAATFIISIFVANHTLSAERLFFVFPIIGLVFIYELFRKSATPFHNIGYTILGLFYVVVPFSLLNLIAFQSFATGLYTTHYILAFFFMLWASDTGAYLAGSRFGKTKLFERISPKKTWEGCVGGTIVTLGVAYLISLFFPELSTIKWMIMGVIIVVFGTLGDLSESMLKRSLGVKDSGNILPGHGGLLDRFDGLLLSIPFVAYYLLFVH